MIERLRSIGNGILNALRALGRLLLRPFQAIGRWWQARRSGGGSPGRMGAALRKVGSALTWPFRTVANWWRRRRGGGGGSPGRIRLLFNRIGAALRRFFQRPIRRVQTWWRQRGARREARGELPWHRRLGNGIRRGLGAGFGRIGRRGPGQQRDILTIRKTGLKRPYTYDPRPTSQLMADATNSVVILGSLGSLSVLAALARIPLLQRFATISWLPATVLGLLAFIVVYRRWRWSFLRARRPIPSVLTAAMALSAFFMLLTGAVGAVLELRQEESNVLLATVLGYPALLAWFWGEGTLFYSKLIRRPRPWEAQLAIAKSGFFIAAAIIMLVYLAIVTFLPQFDTADFLLNVALGLAVAALLVQVAAVVTAYLKERRRRVAPA